MNKAFKKNIDKKMYWYRLKKLWRTKMEQVFASMPKDRSKWPMSNEFASAGEPMPLNEHPLRDEIFAKIDSGEIVFS